MRRHLTILAAVAACLIAAGTRADEILNVGDPAPKLAVSGWVKGEKVDQFEPGKTYVVEFWATWCGPCRVSIPHLTELAHKYKDKGVRFIGVNVWENDTKLVKPFVERDGRQDGLQRRARRRPRRGQADGRRDGQDVDERRRGARHPDRLRHPRRQDRLDRPPDEDG